MRTRNAAPVSDNANRKITDKGLGERRESAIIGLTQTRESWLAVGLTTVAIFLYTGVYMQTGFPELYLADETIRYQYRANHIYLLLAGLLNIVMGIYLSPNANKWGAFLQRLGSLPMILAPLLLIYAFFYEAPQGTPERSYTFFGVVCLLAGTLCHLLQPLLKGNREAVAMTGSGELQEAEQ